MLSITARSSSQARTGVIKFLSFASDNSPEAAADVAEIADVPAIVGAAQDRTLDIEARKPALRILCNLVSYDSPKTAQVCGSNESPE